jgi:hypothetical protein
MGVYVYTFGHELGHIMSGFDPAQSADARKITLTNAQLAALTPALQTLYRIPARSRSNAQQAQLAALQAQSAALYATISPLALPAEQYADRMGQLFYFSFRAAHPHRRAIASPVGPVGLPSGSLP